MDPLSAIRNTFFQECDEQLAELETGLLALEAGDRDPETINAVFRAVHSIKGGGGAFALEPLVRFAHGLETVLDDLRAGDRVLEDPLIKALLRAADILADHVRAARDGGVVDETRSQAALAQLTAPTEAAAPGAAPLSGAWTIRFRPRRALYAHGNEALLLLRELARLGPVAVTLDRDALPSLETLDPEAPYLAWTVTLETDAGEAAIREVFEFVEGNCELDIRPAPAPAADDIAGPMARAQDTVEIVETAADEPAIRTAESAAPATVRVDLDRVDRLINLIGELVINQAMLAQRIEGAGLARSNDIVLGLDDLEQLTREIQDSVMAIRAQPVNAVFRRMPRLAREVAVQTGKRVRLIIEGENAEVDRTVIERLTDPITHMIRNAIDHGLETPERRLAAGKPEEGIVTLSAFHRGGRIVIEIKDDGQGIDRARVRQLAIDRRLIPADANPTDEEIDNLIFAPGFSTAKALSDISGRGVGMDVVKRSVQALGGRIGIASIPGQGSTFTLSLPLTLAVLDGMALSVCGQTMVAPLTGIIETLQPKPGQVHRLGPTAALLAIRDTHVPLHDLGMVFGYRTQPLDPYNSVALLVEGEGGTRAALLVDAIQGQRQVVIKSLESNYRHIPGIAAATILGDGRVALILDIDAVISRRGDPFATEPAPALAAAG